MKRSNLISFVLTLVFTLAVHDPSTAQASHGTLITTAPTQQGAVNTDALREILVKGLKVTRDDQKVYINRVIMLVEKNKLPVSYVYASLRSATKRRPDYPFPFFAYILNGMALKKGIVI